MAAGCGSTHLRLPDLVVPAIDLQLLQQGSDGLPAGLHILGQQDLELLREVLACGREGQCKHLGGCSHFTAGPGPLPCVLVLRNLGPCEVTQLGWTSGPRHPKLTF